MLTIPPKLTQAVFIRELPKAHDKPSSGFTAADRLFARKVMPQTHSHAHIHTHKCVRRDTHAHAGVQAYRT